MYIRFFVSIELSDNYIDDATLSKLVNCHFTAMESRVLGELTKYLIDRVDLAVNRISDDDQ